jgi:adenylate cyclase
MEFSCIGDSVNLASRTEGLTKFFKVTILITENTLKDTNDEFITREIDRVVVTGKKTSVKMYELIGRKGDEIPFNVKQSIECYEKGLQLYRNREYQEACTNFEKGIQIGNDGASKVLLNRVKSYIQDPPDSNWNGDFIASEK